MDRQYILDVLKKFKIRIHGIDDIYIHKAKINKRALEALLVLNDIDLNLLTEGKDEYIIHPTFDSFKDIITIIKNNLSKYVSLNGIVYDFPECCFEPVSQKQYIKIKKEISNYFKKKKIKNIYKTTYYMKSLSIQRKNRFI